MTTAETITISKKEYEDLKAQVSSLMFQLAEMKRALYGAKSERFISANPHQTTLFELAADQRQESPTEEIVYTRRKPQDEKKYPLRAELPPHLERRVEVIEPENLPSDAKMIGEAITEILHYEPASIYVRRIVRRKYIVEHTDEFTRIAIAPLPSLPIPKGNAGASMIAHLLVSKFVDHLPFYRQVQIFKRQNLEIAESTINGWFNAGCDLLEPLYHALKTRMLASDYLMADETPIPVQTKDKPGSTHKGYHWVYYDPVRRLVLFDYRKTRGREGPDDMLREFSGFLQTDGYNAYDHFENKPGITLLACMAHARRKFEHAQENNPILVRDALNMFQALYDIERQAREANLSANVIRDLRKEKSRPVLVQMKSWLDEQIILVPPKSAIGMAIAYTLSLWPRLIRYVDDGRFHIDNNLIENSIRPVALGRKNYLFAGSHEAAQHAAVAYSILATCKLHDVEPFTYLSNLLSIIPDFPVNQLHKLLPGQ